VSFLLTLLIQPFLALSFETWPPTCTLDEIGLYAWPENKKRLVRCCLTMAENTKESLNTRDFDDFELPISCKPDMSSQN